MDFVVGLLALVLPYLVGAILTARHLVYRRKVEKERWGFRPRILRSDYPFIATGATFWWMYWGVVLGGGLLKILLFSGIKKTPGEIEQERKNKEREFQRLVEETERLRKEQEGA